MNKKEIKLSMIAAMTKNHVIGKDNDMPWHLPDDLQFFKKNTLGKPVIMGRKTFESLGCRPLPNRPNLVISRQTDLDYSVPVFSCVEDALKFLVGKAEVPEEVVIMGGGQLYRQMINEVNKLYITEIDAELEGDTFFPDFDRQDWEVIAKEHHPADEKHQYAFDFITLRKKI